MDGTKRIKDSQRSELVEPQIDLEVRSRNLLELDLEGSTQHLGQLAEKLLLLNRMLDEKLGEALGDTSDLGRYLNRLSAMIDLLRTKHEIARSRPGSDIQIGCTVDPTDSGFPVFVRDLHFLRRDRTKAEASLRSLPSDEQLVERAIFSVFRGVYPTDVVRDKLDREFNRRLLETKLPVPRRNSRVKLERKRGGLYFGRMLVERLDLHKNIPRFYKIYFKATSWPDRGKRWDEELEAALEQGLSTVVDAELPFAARKIEAIPGLRLEMIERFDIGPFLNRFSEEEGVVGQLLEDHPNESMLMLQRHTVQRIGEKERTGGFFEKLPFWWNRDTKAGSFTPTIASARYAIMTHQMIQDIHARDLDLGGDLFMYGTTEGGQLL